MTLEVQRYEAGEQVPNINALAKMKARYSCEYDLIPKDLLRERE